MALTAAEPTVIDVSAGHDAIGDLLGRLADDGRVIHVESLPARPDRFAELSRPLRPEVADRLGVDRLWCHQAEAIDLIRSGTSVVVATSTASGKSLCYQAAIADAVADPDQVATALAFFPTKALAHDQLRSVSDHRFPLLVPATYDGDSDPEHRSWVRNHANLVLTNPEMVHGGLLPSHRRWSQFLRRLRFVVIDELHVFRGVFGTHMGHVLRRLRRVCEHYGADPTFVFTSATIGDPARLASQLCGGPVTAVTDDGSPRGARRFALLNPPVLDEASGVRSSTNAEAAAVISELVAAGHRTISFCASRKGTELVAGDVRSRLGTADGDRVRSYRGGYLATERREIEAELASGRIRAVVATSALELGVDIGGLDGCVLNGFPGTIASMWQQAGRAGRRRQDSVTVLVAGDDQLDQWLMRHPHEVFTRPPEPAVINPDNPRIADAHVACGAFELPLSHDDLQWWPTVLDEAVGRLCASGRVRVRAADEGPLAVWAGGGWPSRGVGLRSGSSREYTIRLPDSTLVGTVDETRAFDVVHPGAVYLHRGDTYRVDDLDLDALVATVEPFDGTEYTQARSTIDIAVRRCDQARTVGASELHVGEVEVTTTVTGFQRREVRSRKILGHHELDLPPQRLITRAFWYTVDPAVVARAGAAAADLAGTLHAIEHAAIGMLPLFTICDRWDVGGVSTAVASDTGLPSIFVYDGYPGGAGIAELGFEAADRHLVATLEAIEGCRCRDGCPSCIQSPKCGNGNDPLDKAGAIALLQTILT